MKTIPIDLSTLRNLIFDIGGLDREFVTQQYFIDKGITDIDISDIISADNEEQYFYWNRNDKTLWQPKCYRESAERHYKERERNAKDVSRHELRKEALTRFASNLYKVGYVKSSKEQRIAIGEMLLRKRNFIKFAALSGLDLTEDKWKGLME